MIKINIINYIDFNLMRAFYREHEIEFGKYPTHCWSIHSINIKNLDTYAELLLLKKHLHWMARVKTSADVEAVK